MIGVAEFGQMKVRGFGKSKRSGPRKGSRKYAVLADGSIVKWWNGEWRFQSQRLNTKVATSLQLRAMSIAEENGRMVTDCERYTRFEDFAERLVRVVGLDALIKIVAWIQS